MAESNDIFEANLRALRRTEPGLAAKLEAVEPAALKWAPSKAGPLTAQIDHGGRALWLASRYDPAKEVERLTASLDYGQTAGVVVLGVAIGYHVAEVVGGLGRKGLAIVFEPDLALLRAVLEKVDHTSWLGKASVVLATPETTRAELVSRVEKYAAILTQGTQLLTHPASRQRSGEAVARFSKLVTETIAFCRTNVATALVNSARTCRNLAGNLAPYAAGATLEELTGAAKGYPAVCVAAGPSLAKNVDLLRDPEVRKKVVVISVQTTLKPLLDRGIRPNFVTALDYSHICQRFYEGLPELPDVTLVAEPKAHPTVLESFPGPVRLVGSSFNDQLLGPLKRPVRNLKSGATVAHLSFYLAQHLGCDPIIFIGQDLGFSDGLYYAPGTAVHQVWSGELNAFNTLEMMEWQRIARHKAHLQRLEDVNGQPIFSDEQMVTYLKQFERDFAQAEQTVIDASEGGAPRDHVARMTLAAAIQKHATRVVPALPVPPREPDPERLAAVRGLLQKRRKEVGQLQQVTRATLPILDRMLRHQRDRAKMRKLDQQLRRQQKRAQGELNDAFQFVDTLNTVGAYRRARTDRAIAHQSGDAFERQRQQIERDQVNLDWLIQACDEAMQILDEALERAERHERAPAA
ncbi:MAG: 6-hydroxymethylpterin diphosphokinase MptE-like protein, partial [Phycisphaeraceae bacterium]